MLRGQKLGECGRPDEGEKIIQRPMGELSDAKEEIEASWSLSGAVGEPGTPQREQSGRRAWVGLGLLGAVVPGAIAQKRVDDV